MKTNLLTAIAVAVISLVFSAGLMAQSTTSAIRGKIIDEQGLPVSGASVMVTDTRTGSAKTLTSNNAGTFFASNLEVGGPYVVTVNAIKSVTVDSVELGDIYSLTIEMTTAMSVEEIIVLGQSAEIIDVASGPAATFSSFDIDTAVSLNRDIKDVYFIDPRLNIDEPDGGASLNCVGKHPRFNSVTLDGVSQDDRFGLNSNGYATATGMPFPYDAVSQVAVELAPFDSSYGGFSACNINAVTRSGSNEWTGNVFYEWTSDDLRGDEIDGTPVTSQAYDERRKGFTLGGPIVEDKLFFYVAYEESEEPEFIAQGYDGSGNGEERDWLSESDYERIRQIAIDQYDYDPGEQPTNGAQTQEKLMLKLDWQINDDHSASIIYNSYEGVEDRASDSDDDEFEFANHFYQKGSETSSTSLFVNSQWTDQFSTELFINSSTMDDSQITVGPKDFAEIQITLPGYNTVYLGADDSRQANALNTESDLIKISAQYLTGDHVISAGFQTEELTIFNQFVQHSQGGEIRFDSIDDFEAGTLSRYYYGSGGGSNDADDAAAQFSNRLNTFFVQDEYYMYDYDLTITAGLRYDFFTSSDSPVYNQNFFDENGVTNDTNIDGLDLLMPRLGFTWNVNDQLTLRGGAGLFSGGNPNVWLSNAWSNDGISNVQTTGYYSGESLFSDIDLIGSGRAGYDVPQSLYDNVAAVDPSLGLGSTGYIVLIDPDYEQPSEWKYALGGTYYFDADASVDVDFLYSVAKDSAYYVDLSQEVVGYTILDQPIYDYKTTGYTGTDNYMLTNAEDEAYSFTFSTVFRKSFDYGLDITLGYAYTEAEDISPMTSSTAGSNFESTATLDVNNLVAGTSNYETPHRLTFRATYGKEFFEGYESRFTTTIVRKSGQPQSYVMQGSDLEGDGYYGRHLLYVPTDASDPNVIFDPGFDTAGFFDWVAENDLTPGQFTRRNETHASYSTRMDLRIDQEIPGFWGDAKGNLFFKMNNVLNFINSDWGAQYDNQFYPQQVVSGGVDSTTGQYIFETFYDRDVNDLLDTVSVWEATLGVEFKF